MKKYSFRIFVPFVGNLKGIAIIDCEAEDWNELVTKERILGDLPVVDFLKDNLQCAYCLHGQTFSLEKHTPAKLYEALNGMAGYEFEVAGDVPENPYGENDLPDGAIY